MVTKRISELEEEDGAGNTETDAPESTRKFLEERVSMRYRREEEELAGRKKRFFPPASEISDQEQGCLCFCALSMCVLWNQHVKETGDRDL